MNRQRSSSLHLTLYITFALIAFVILLLFLPFQRLARIGPEERLEISSHSIIRSASGQTSDADRQAIFLPMVMSDQENVSPPLGETETPSPSLTPSLTPKATRTIAPLPTLDALPTATPSETPSPTPSPTTIPSINLALGKPAMQSSVAFGGVAGLANDGGTDGDFGNGSVSQTRFEDQPWWQVNLAPSPFKLETVELFEVDGRWQTVTLKQTYSSMVAVCSQIYQNNTIPTVIRMRNAAENGFDIKLQNPGEENKEAIEADTVICLVMEEGDYYLPDGTLIEAQTYNSTVTSNNNKWEGEAQTLTHAFTSPVVFGQVMSTNDERWSTFWSHGTGRTAAASADSLFTGKHVGQDPDLVRNDETIGFIVIEAGAGTVDTGAFQVGLSEKIVASVTSEDVPFGIRYATPFNTAPRGAIVSQSGVSGTDGSWAYIISPPFTAEIQVAVDEDQLADNERGHAAEQVGYFVYSAPLLIGPPPGTSEEAIGNIFNIDELVIFNRTDCCLERLTDLYVFVSNEDMSDRTVEELIADENVWHSTLSGPLGAVTNLPVDEIGSFVKIQLGADEAVLALSEVQVLGRSLSDGQAYLQVGRISPKSVAVEATGEQAIYQVQRQGPLEATSYPFAVLEPGAPRTFDPAMAFVLQESGLSLSSGALAQASDFVIKDGKGNVLTDTLPFEAGQETAELIIEAVADEQLEVPELVHIEFVSDGQIKVLYTNEINVTLSDDNEGIREDSKLFVGVFGPENGANTTAYGYATVRLSGDNRYGMVNVTFSGLTSEQTAAHIHISNPGDQSGPVAFSLPLGQVQNEQWGIKGAHFLTTDQEMLDALLGGGLYVNVHSTLYPAGEIKAILNEQSGTGGGSGPDFNYPPPPYEDLSGEALEQDIVRFLSQATFGPTPELVADLKARVEANGGDRIAAYAEWIDEQIQMEAPSHLEYYLASRKSYVAGAAVPNDALRNVNSYNHAMFGGWLTAAMYGEAQLRERTAFALSEILVVAPLSAQHNPSIIDYNDMLKRNAFGRYEVLLHDVSRHYAMGVWLSHYKNRKTTLDSDGNIIASPDENYAREIMQLFSIGLLELHPDGTLRLGADGLPLETYDQDDISELARVFTGWGLGAYVPNRPDDRLLPVEAVENNNFNRNPANGVNFLHTPGQWTPMKNFEAQHDSGRKEVLGYVFPAGVDGETELRQVVDILNAHPNTAPFIAYRMIQRLTTSNPSPGYVYRVSTAFTDSNGNLGEMVRAILLDPEVRNLDNLNQSGVGKVREPLIQLVGICRLLDCSSNQALQYPLTDLTTYGLPAAELSKYEADASRIFINASVINGNNSILQAPFRSPTVFNWFQPDYSPAGPLAEGGLTAPELQHISESIIVSYFNLMYNVTLNPNSLAAYRARQGGPTARLVATPPQELIDGYMSVMDSDGDGLITEIDAAFNDPDKVREASGALVDVADDYLCGGWLKADTTGDPTSDPREIIINGVIESLDHLDGTTPANALAARDQRIEEALLMLMVAPQCNVQR
ncbi:MAG: DUF1800 family protein [Chloroflexota bacterium]